MSQSLIKIGGYEAFQPDGKLEIIHESGALPGESRVHVKYTHACRKYYFVFGNYVRQEIIDDKGMKTSIFHLDDLIETVLDGVPCDLL
jgi:hypothetical protein